MKDAYINPWGTPDLRYMVLLSVCPIRTCKVRFFNHELRKLISIAASPSLMALCRTPMSQTLSKAFLASKKYLDGGIREGYSD